MNTATSTLGLETETDGDADGWEQLELTVFQKGTRRGAVATAEPTLTLGKSGGGLNHAADAALGTPEAVGLLVDERRGVLVFRPATLSDPNAFSLGPVPRQRGCRISMLGFFARYGIDHAEARHIAGHVYNGGLLFELGAPLVPVHG